MRRILLVFFILMSAFAYAQTQRVKGKVTSAIDPTGMPGVTVAVKGTSFGTITDLAGEFTLELTPGALIEFSFVGFKSQMIIFRGQTIIDVLLEEQTSELGEVVVLGYSSIDKRNLTGAVTTLSADKLKDISMNGLDQALQGQAPGVQVVQSSGTPGGGVSVRIRGSTSITAGNRPLYIIDGIPVETGNLTSRDFGGQTDNALTLINPNDIESYTILSDASAKVLYGSRASNGVVVITTKRGKNAKTKISFDVQRGAIDVVRKLPLLNSTQLLDLQREAVANSGQNPDGFGLIPGVSDAVNTNWQDEVLRTAILQQYQLSITAGNQNTKVYLSGSYRGEEGVQLNNKFERMSFTSNIDQKLSEKFSVSTGLTLSRAFNMRVKGDNFLDGVYSGAIKSLPYSVPYDENGFLVGPGSSLYAGFPNFNPVAQALLPRFNTTTVKVLASVNATYLLKPNLILKAQASLDYNSIVEDQYESSQTAIGGFLPSVGGQGYGVFSASTISNVNSYLTLNYNKDLSIHHKISGVLGTELYQNYSIGGSVQGRLFPSDDFTYITSAGVIDAGSSLRDAPHSILSFFGEGRYDFDGRIFFTASMRADGSSNFGPNHRLGYFPAISAAWRISDEKFFQNFFHSELISGVKLRASLGITGNERIPAYAFLGTWGSSTYSGGTGVGPSTIPNPNIKWETTRESNIGVDLDLMQGRIQAVANVYYNKTYDLLLSRPYAGTTGFTGVLDNIGQMENKGIEFSLTSVNVDSKIRWITTLNISKNLNKVLFLADSTPLYRGYAGEGVDGTNIITKGQPLGTFWGLNYLGVNPATGNAMYQDRNKDEIINNSDAMVIGNSQPKFYGGVTNRVQFMGFDLTVLFNYSYGNKVLNFTKASLVNMGADLQTEQSTEALRRWQKPGDITDIPRYEYGSTLNNSHSNRLLEDASYLRLKNLSFGYNIPGTKINRLMLDQLRVYVSCTNLWTYTKYTGSDPEVSTLDGSTSAQGIDFFTLPQVRTISFGISATLK